MLMIFKVLVICLVISFLDCFCVCRLKVMLFFIFICGNSVQFCIIIVSLCLYGGSWVMLVLLIRICLLVGCIKLVIVCSIVVFLELEGFISVSILLGLMVNDSGFKIMLLWYEMCSEFRVILEVFVSDGEEVMVVFINIRFICYWLFYVSG